MQRPVGALIKQRREALNISQKKLGEACGVSDSEIQKIESGQRKSPNWITLCKIAKALSFHPFDLMLAAGYIDESDINPSQIIQGLDRLNEEDIEVIQNLVNAQVAKNAKKLASITEFRMDELFCGLGGLARGATPAQLETHE